MTKFKNYKNWRAKKIICNYLFLSKTLLFIVIFYTSYRRNVYTVVTSSNRKVVCIKNTWIKNNYDKKWEKKLRGEKKANYIPFIDLNLLFSCILIVFTLSLVKYELITRSASQEKKTPNGPSFCFLFVQKLSNTT